MYRDLVLEEFSPLPCARRFWAPLLSDNSPLLRAMVLGKPWAVRFLLDHGASTLRKLPGPEGAGMTVIDLAERGRIEDEIRKMVKEVGER